MKAQYKYYVVMLYSTGSMEKGRGFKEKIVYVAMTKKTACEMAMSRNRSPYNTMYIVGLSNGERIAIADQIKYLKEQPCNKY